MFHHTLLSEWSKLRSTASFWWTSGLILFFSVGWGALTASLTPAEEVSVGFAGSVTAGFTFSMIVVIVQAAMVVTTEYRYGLNTINFLATPRRWQVALAKAILYAVLVAVLTFVTLVLTYAVHYLILSAKGDNAFNTFSDESGQYFLWAYPLLMVLLTFFSQGVGLLLRHTAGTISLLLIWFMMLESLIGSLPRIGENIQKYLPFTNFNSFYYDSPTPGTEWDPWISLIIFAVWAAVLWIAGVFVTQKRDA